MRGASIPQTHSGLAHGPTRSIFGDPDRQRLPDHIAVRTDLVLNTPILSTGNFAYVGNFRHAVTGIQVTTKYLIFVLKSSSYVVRREICFFTFFLASNCSLAVVSL